MSGKGAGALVTVLGLGVAAWAWLGLWPWSGRAIYSGSDFAVINGAALGVTILGCVVAIAGVLLVFSGRGGPDEWSGR